MALGDDIGLSYILPSGGDGGGVSILGAFGGDIMITIMWCIVGLLAIGIVAILIKRHMDYKYRVILNEPRGKTLLRGVTEARKVEEKDGSKRWFIKSLKKKVAIPNLEHISPSMEKRLRAGVIELLRVDEETFIAVNLAYKFEEATQKHDIKIVPLANSLNNIRQIHSDLTRDYSSVNWFKDNAAMLVQGAIFLVLIGAVVILVSMFQDIAATAASSVTSAANTNAQLAELVEKMNQCNVGSVI